MHIKTPLVIYQMFPVVKEGRCPPWPNKKYVKEENGPFLEDLTQVGAAIR